MMIVNESETYGLEQAKRIFKGISKELRRKIEQKFINAKFRHCYPDFWRGVYQVRLSLHGVIINRTFDLFIEPSVILESLEGTLHEELQEIFGGCFDGGDC